MDTDGGDGARTMTTNVSEAPQIYFWNTSWFLTGMWKLKLQLSAFMDLHRKINT